MHDKNLHNIPVKMISIYIVQCTYYCYSTIIYSTIFIHQGNTILWSSIANNSVLLCSELLNRGPMWRPIHSRWDIGVQPIELNRFTGTIPLSGSLPVVSAQKVKFCLRYSSKNLQHISTYEIIDGWNL